MPEDLKLDEGFPQLLPDPPQAHVQFSARWRVTNVGDEPSQPAGVRVDLMDASGPILTGIGRDVAPLPPGDSDDDVIGVGAVGRGSGTLEIRVALYSPSSR